MDNNTKQIYNADFVFTVKYPEESYCIPMQDFKPTNGMKETLPFNAGQITAIPVGKVIPDDPYKEALVITFQTEF